MTSCFKGLRWLVGEIEGWVASGYKSKITKEVALTKNNTLLEAALGYAKLGWFIFPIKYKCKHPPLIKKWQINASNNKEQIKEWWKQLPTANIGLACGKSRVVVVDLDERRDGVDNWKELCQKDSINDDTLTSITGGGGLHLFFKAPLNIEIRSGNDKLGDGIDIKAKGGYVLLPPSIHPSGNKYQWELSSFGNDFVT